MNASTEHQLLEGSRPHLSQHDLREIVFRDESLPGVLVAFCGSDGSGKTTQIARLAEFVQSQGKACVLTKQPTPKLRESYLFDRYIHHPDGASEIEYRALSFATVSDRIQHSVREIRPALQRGEVVISDRYFFSAIANLRARGYRKDSWIYEVATWLPKPDLAVFLDVPYELSLQRVRARPSEAKIFIDEDFDRKLNAEFALLPAAFANSLKINTEQDSEDQVFEKVKARVQTILQQRER